MRKTRKQYPDSFKQQIIAERTAGAMPAQIAAKHGIKVSLVWNWMTQARKAGVKIKTPKSRTGKARAKVQARTGDAEVIVTQLLASLRPGLIEAVTKLVNLGVERKLADARNSVMDALKRAA